ncbi:hypothetical protein A2U01_0110322, partial [Trifolium medium]|nr:hypothetical protein [Trifolium medium]
TCIQECESPPPYGMRRTRLINCLNPDEDYYCVLGKVMRSWPVFLVIGSTLVACDLVISDLGKWDRYP